MNTKPIPILIVLLASCIACGISVFQRVEFTVFFHRFLYTVLIFTVIGIVVKILLDIAFKKNEEEGEGEEGEGEGTEGEEGGEGEAEGEGADEAENTEGANGPMDEDDDEDDDL